MASPDASRRALEIQLESLLGFGEVSDVFDHLASIDTSDDLLDYLSQLLGTSGQEVQEFVADLCRYQCGEELVHITVEDDGTAVSDDAGAPASSAANEQTKGSQTSWKEQLERDEKERKTREEKAENQVAALALEEKKLVKEQAEGEEAKINLSGRKKLCKTPSKPPTRVRAKKKSPALSSQAQSPSSEETKVDASASSLPLRGKAKVICGCFGTRHKSLTNCLHCGRIACQKEGYGYCPFCGYRIEKTRVNVGAGEKFEKALLHKERLLKFDREFTKRTTILDDQADYYSNSKSQWLEENERADAEEKDDDRRKELHERKNQTLKLDF